MEFISLFKYLEFQHFNTSDGGQIGLLLLFIFLKVLHEFLMTVQMLGIYLDSLS